MDGYCEYEEIKAQCNILIISSAISSSFGNFGVGNENSYHEEEFKTEFNNLIQKLKNNNIRIVYTIPEINEIIIELQNDKNIAVIKEDLSKSDYFDAFYNVAVSLDI